MIEYLEQTIRDFDEQIESVLAPFREAVDHLVTIPGISTTAAQLIVAEIGADMSRFAAAAHLRSWVGLCAQFS
jgi:transposase